MYKIKFNMPLNGDSEIEFFIGDEKYVGNIDRILGDRWYIYSRSEFQNVFVNKVFEPLGIKPEEYYKSVLGEPIYSGIWPETSFEHLVQVLRRMQEDYEKLNKNMNKRVIIPEELNYSFVSCGFVCNNEDEILAFAKYFIEIKCPFSVKGLYIEPEGELIPLKRSFSTKDAYEYLVLEYNESN